VESAPVEPPGFVGHRGTDANGFIFVVGEGCKGCGPGDVTVTVWVAVVAAFGENPFCSGEGFS